MVEDFQRVDSIKDIDSPDKPEDLEKVYTIIEEFESVDNDDVDSTLTKITSAKINPWSFPSKLPEGFEFLPENKIIENNVLTVKYTRKRITLTFDPNGGEWDLTEGVHELKGKYGERLPLVDISQIKKIDEKFVGWSENLNAETVTTVRIPETYPAEDHTYYSVWDAVNSNYIVKIYEENLNYPEGATDDQKYTLVAMNAAAGIPGHKSNYKAISRYGFHVESFEQVVIKGIDEPSEVLNVYYDRRIYTYKFDLDAAYAKWKNVDGNEHNDYHSERYISGKYESDFTHYSCIECYRDETNFINNNGEEVHGDIWNFEGWNEVGGKVDIKFTQDREYIAVWDKGPPEYTIRHLFEQADGSYVPDSRYPDEKYSAGSEILTKAKAYDGVPGYYALPFKQQEVNEDSSTVVEIKYNRATVTVTMNANGGFFNRGEQIVKVSGKYLDPIMALPPPPIKEHHDFVKWQSVHGDLSANPTFPAKNIRYEAVYKRTGALYGVEYYLEKLEYPETAAFEQRYSMSRDDTDTKVGDYNAASPVPVTFEIKNHKGFEFVDAYIGKNGTSKDGLTVSGDKTSITIAGIAENDSTVVRVYMKRKLYNVTFDPNGLIWNAAGTWNGQNHDFKEDVSPRTLTNLKYGTLINAVRTDFHSKDKREVFDYWSPDFTGVVTDAPVQEYKAITKSMTVPFTIRYLFENLKYPKDPRKYIPRPDIPDVIDYELPGFRTQVLLPDVENDPKFAGFRLNNVNSEHDIIVSEDESNRLVEIKL
ncbi:InlB B-repeat-containing protein, partial [Treponema sp.]|uniref:InlB B-repeat-containing protein n=1 Tax=Treponema sp. TaxID=166 RepID=UPI00298DD471